MHIKPFSIAKTSAINQSKLRVNNKLFVEINNMHEYYRKSITIDFLGEFELEEYFALKSCASQ